MGLVALLLTVDLLILTAWYLTDPIRCSRSVAAAFKVLFIYLFILAEVEKRSEMQKYQWEFISLSEFSHCR